MPGLRLQRLAKVPWDRWFLPTLLVARFAVGVWYSVSIPLWEAFDEPGHYQYADYLARNRSLLKEGDPAAERIWERFQPPLYYVLVASAIFWVERPEPPEPVRNPYFHTGVAGLNYAVHSDDEAFPYRGTALAVHVGRLVSVALSLLATYWAHRSSQIVFGQRRELAAAATALFAFWPQFVFVGSVITNDILAITLATLVLFLSLRLVTAHGHWLDLPLLAVGVSLAFLAKANALGLLPLLGWTIGVGLFVPATKQARVRFLVLIGLILLLGGLTWRYLLSAPYVSVGDLLATASVWTSQALDRPVESLRGTADFVARTWPYTAQTFLGVFGWGNVPLPTWQYVFWGAASVAALVGLAFSLGQQLRRRTWPQKLVLCLLHTLGFIGIGLGLARLAGDPYLFPGRYALPCLASLTILMVHGWKACFARLSPAMALGGLVAAMVITTMAIPPTILRPAYARPPVIAESDVQAPHRPHVVFGDEIELIGYDVEPEAIAPGGTFDLILYFRALQPMARDYSLYLEAVGPGYVGLGTTPLVTYPGRGTFPTSLWQPQGVIQDRYRLSIPGDFPGPSLAYVHLFFFDPVSEARPIARDSAGRPLTSGVYLKGVKVTQTAAPDASKLTPVDYRFASAIQLVGYRVELVEPGRLRVHLLWKALERPERDYTVFLHLRDRGGRVVAQQDGPPRRGWYPTSNWDRGEHVPDAIEIQFDGTSNCGPMNLYLGLYESGSLVRARVTRGTGEELPEQQVELGEGLVLCE